MVKKTSHDAEKTHEAKKHVFEAEKAVRQKKYIFAAEKSCSLCNIGVVSSYRKEAMAGVL